MKKYLFMLAIGMSQLLAAQTNAPQPTRYISQQAYSSSVALTNYERCFYFRLPNGLVDQFQTDLWDGTQFTYDNTRYFTYDPDGKLVSTVNRKWDATNGYTDYARETYTYDPNGNRTQESAERLHTTTGVWEQERTVSFTYSATGKVLERTNFSYFNGQGYGSRSLYTYDADDREETVTYQNYTNNTWINQQRNTNWYNDPDDKVDVVFNDGWSQTLNDWAPVNRTAYNYQPTMTVALTEAFSNGAWSNYSSTTTQYNADLQVTFFQFYLYTPQGLSPNSGYEIDYNSDKSLHQFRYYLTDFSNNVYYPSLQIDYDYDMYTGTHSAQLEADVEIFPNPATDFLHIRSKDAVEGMRYEVQNIHGQMLAQGTVQEGNSMVDCHTLAPGAYFLLLSQNGRSKTIVFVRN